jgi:hypothetical protein
LRHVHEQQRERDGRRACGDERRGRIARTVIDDDRFEDRRFALRRKRVERSLQKRDAILRGDHDAELHDA